MPPYQVSSHLPVSNKIDMNLFGPLLLQKLSKGNSDGVIKTNENSFGKWNFVL